MTIKAALVSIDLGKIDFAASLDEFHLLVKSAGAQPVISFTGRRAAPDARLFMGSGKADELKSAMAADPVEIVVFNHVLTPGQQRNLEHVLGTRVVDRNTLILDIFAQRAKSHEGKLQVELAQLQYLSTRLVRAWTHLERQKGGIGLRGPGETQLETDRRLIGERIKLLKARLARLQRQHDTRRRQRERNAMFTVSLVGYTNAGKSTLFNALTKAQAYAADQLFATLDTMSRRLYLEAVGNVVLSDTVGFVRDLPHQLVAAFRATLEETVHAHLLLHVVDAASPVRDEQIRQVDRVLREIGAANVRQILVFNKVDAVPALAERAGTVEQDEYGNISRIFLSAREGLGLDALRAALCTTLGNATASEAMAGMTTTPIAQLNETDLSRDISDPAEKSFLDSD